MDQMKKDGKMEEFLLKALKEFEQAKEKIEAHSGFCRTSEELRILEEMIKEQRVVHEDSGLTARASR